MSADNNININSTSKRQRGKTTDLLMSAYKKKNSSYKKNVWTITDSYLLYVRDVGKENAVDKKVYIKVLKEIFWEMSKDLIQSVYEITLPYRLGKLGIKKRKNNSVYSKQQLDYARYNKTGEKHYHNNTHSNRHYFFWNWETSDRAAVFTNQKCYKFIPTRGNDGVVGKRGLAAWIKYCADNPYVKDYDRLIKR